LVALARFLPARAKDLSAPLYKQYQKFHVPLNKSDKLLFFYQDNSVNSKVVSCNNRTRKNEGCFSKRSLGKLTSAPTLLMCIRKVTGLNLAGTPAILNQYVHIFLEALQVISGKESQNFKDAFLSKSFAVHFVHEPTIRSHIA
jgi:hypothetical protein